MSLRRMQLLLVLLAMMVAGCKALRVPSFDPTGERIFSGQTTNLTLPDPHDITPKPAFQNAPAAPPCPTAGAAPPCGHHPGSILPAAQLRDTSYVVMMPGRVVAPVGSEVIVVSGICGENGYYVTRQPLEWMLSPDSVGHLMQVSNNKWCFLTDWIHANDAKKLDLDWAKNKTHTHRQTVDRGTPALNDDVVLGKGQSWVSIMSPSEGVSYVTAMAPKEENWDRRRQTATIYWVDAQWTLPPHQIARVDRREPALLTTTLTRSQGLGPIENWLVRYEILDGPAAVFENNARAIEVPTDINGQATARILPQAGEAGITQVSVHIIRPPSIKGDSPRMVVGQGLTSVTWSAPGLAVRASGPPTADADQPVSYRVEVSNTGDVMAPDVVLAYAVPEGCTVTGHNPPAQLFGNRLEWRLGNLPARGAAPAVEVTVAMRLQARYDHRFRATSLRGTGELSAEGVASTIVNRSALVVRMTGPQTTPIGGQATFLAEIENVSSLPATNIMLTDIFDAGLEHISGKPSPLIANIETLQPGQKQAIAFNFIVRQAGRHCHRLEVTADGGLKTVAEACVAATGEAPTPRMAVKISGPPRLAIGEKGQYEIEVRNVGSVPLTNLRIGDQYSASFRLTGASEGRKLNRGEVYWELAELPVGQGLRWLVEVEGARPDPSARHVATVTSEQGITQTADAVTQIAGPGGDGAAAPNAPVIPDNTPIPGSLKLALNPSANPASVGRDFTLRLDLKNDSTEPDQAINILIEKPEDLEFLRSSVPTTVDKTRLTISIKALRGNEAIPIDLRLKSSKAGRYPVRVTVRSQRVQEGLTETREISVVPE